MKTYRHTVKASEGLHARPAGQFAKLAGGCSSTIEMQKGAEKVNVRRIMSVMKLCVKQGDTIDFFIDGEDEADVLSAVEHICQDTL